MSGILSCSAFDERGDQRRLTYCATLGPVKSGEDGSRQQSEEHMWKARFTEDQMVKILRDEDKALVAHEPGGTGSASRRL